MTDNLQVRFRRAGAADLDYIMRQERHDENHSYIRQWTREKHLADLKDSNYAYFVVERVDSGKPVGFVILIGANDPDNNLEFKRIAISEKGRGYGREAVKLIKKFAFDETDTHRLWLEVIDYNERAYHIYESEGFVKEGVHRESFLRDGRRASLIVMSMLRPEYER